MKTRRYPNTSGQYQDGSDPQILDIIDIPVLGPQSTDYQAENWLLDPERYWGKAGTFDPNRLSEMLDPIASLWINGNKSYHGLNDRISLESVLSISGSLRLIHVESLTLRVFSPGETFGNPKRRVQGRFRHSGMEYALWTTDPKYERTYLAKPDGTYELGHCYLTISLGEPYQDFVYKLIAAVIETG